MNRKIVKLLPIVLSIILSSCVATDYSRKVYINASVSQKKEVLRVGFDLDDTLLFSTPAFKKGFDSNFERFSPEFWKVVNSSDREVSKIKESVFRILKDYQKKGAEIFIITSRKKYGVEPLLKFIKEKFNVPRSHVYFTHEKADVLAKLGIDIYFGDSDTDISAALDAGCKPVRILRNPESSYKSNYNPGIYGEKIIKNSEE